VAGTQLGGYKARDKNLAKDPDFYRKLGQRGGRKSRGGGFAANPELARIAGAKGGRISRRGKPKQPELPKETWFKSMGRKLRIIFR